MGVNRGREEINVAFENKKKKAEDEVILKVKEVKNEKEVKKEDEEVKEEEKEESKVIWEAVNFALAQLNLDSSKESAGTLDGEKMEEEVVTRKSSENERLILKLQPTNKLKSAGTLANEEEMENVLMSGQVAMRRSSEKEERPILKLQPTSCGRSSTKLKSGCNQFNLIKIKRSPVAASDHPSRRKVFHNNNGGTQHQHQHQQGFGKQIPKLVPVARSSITKPEESKSKPGANHLNLIQVCSCA